MDASELVDAGSFRDGMRHLVGAVTLITTCHEGQRRGLTATAVCSLTAEPPALLACINGQAEAHDLIVSSGRFGVSVLAFDHRGLAESFAARDGVKGEARFARGDWAAFGSGVPYLRDSLAAFDCRVSDRHAFETHTIFMGRVVAVRCAEGDPLLYAKGQFKRLEAAGGGDARGPLLREEPEDGVAG